MADVTGRTSRPPNAGYGATTGPGTDPGSLTGLNEDEAKSFGNMFVVSFLAFLAIAIVAHYLVWQWRPWIPGAEGYPTNIPTRAAIDAITAYFA